MGKIRDLFKKTRDMGGGGGGGIFHAKMGTRKDRNSLGPTEAESNKKWQEYTEERYKEIIMSQITTRV